MADTSLRIDRAAATKCGLTLDEYRALRAAGLKRCTKCKEWRDVAKFDVDRSRFDERKAKCMSCTRSPDPYAGLRRRPSPKRGIPLAQDTKDKLSAAMKGRAGPMVGRKHSDASRSKMSISMRASTKKRRGADHHSFRDGRLAERRGARFSADYRRWRDDVFRRDGYICRSCGDARGGNLHAHHVKSFADFPDLRFVVENGLTLCEPCHKAVHAT